METGSAPTDAHLALNALLARVLLEVARRRQEELPGLTETLQDQVLVTMGGTTRKRVGGWYYHDAWRLEERSAHELFINANWRGERSSLAEAAQDVLVTLLHEGCHAYAEAQGIKDTTRDGRYHNRRFAEIALRVGLKIEKDPKIGHRTPQLSTRGRHDYADLLSELEQGLILAREPQPVRPNAGNDEGQLTGPPDTAHPQVSTSKYVFASCDCLTGRSRRVTIRVARGSWRPGVIRCGVCGAVFIESLTEHRQSGPDRPPLTDQPDATSAVEVG